MNAASIGNILRMQYSTKTRMRFTIGNAIMLHELKLVTFRFTHLLFAKFNVLSRLFTHSPGLGRPSKLERGSKGQCATGRCVCKSTSHLLQNRHSHADKLRFRFMFVSQQRACIGSVTSPSQHPQNYPIRPDHKHSPPPPNPKSSSTAPPALLGASHH